jgi:anti-anti-sigma factor
MTVKLSIVGKKMIVTIEGKFEFSAHADFRRAVDTGLGAATVSAAEVDLEKTEYMDSAALGMLLVLRDKASAAGKGTVTLRSSGSSVGQVLEVANFARMFTIA